MINFKVDVAAFWVATPCSVAVGYRRFRGPCCLHLLNGPQILWMAWHNIAYCYNPEDRDLNFNAVKTSNVLYLKFFCHPVDKWLVGCKRTTNGNVSLVSRGSSVGIAAPCGVDDWDSGIRFPAGAGNFSLLHRFHIGSGGCPASSSTGTGGSGWGVKLTIHLLLVPKSRMRLHVVALS
jgi:hypothetical protein